MSQDFVGGQRLGDYEILGVLGTGGMGKVYKVRNIISDRVEAMKILLPNLASQKELAERFLREIKLLATLNHPNIAALRTALTLDNQLVMIMEYVEGMTLALRLQQGPIPPLDAVNYVDQVLAALSYAHHLNVIHRDIKPANMMLTPQGVVKLMDFGIARSTSEGGLTATGATLGSLNYMPPEQVKAEPVDARSDLYSLGVSLYEMVTGQLPFKGDSGYSLMAAHLQEQPRPPATVRPDLPRGLNEIILMALAKEPGKRFQSADAFRNALKSVPSTGAAAAQKPAPVVAPVGQPSFAPPPAVSHGGPSPVVPTRPIVAAPYQQTQPLAAATPGVEPSAAVTRSSHRGFYMALGALVVAGVLFGASLYLPRRTKTHASTNSTNLPSATSPSSQSGAEPGSPSANPLNAQPLPANPPAADTNGANASPSGTDAGPSGSKGRTAPVERKNAGQSAPVKAPQQDAQQQSGANSTPQPPSSGAAELEEAEQQADQLSSRASAVSQSLDGLRRQQSAQGYGLRGDIVSSEERMHTYLSKAQLALQQQDAAKAKKYLDLTEIEAEKIERFLGR